MIGLCSFLQVARDTRLLHQKVGGGIRSWKVPQEKNVVVQDVTNKFLMKRKIRYLF